MKYELDVTAVEAVMAMGVKYLRIASFDHVLVKVEADRIGFYFREASSNQIEVSKNSSSVKAFIADHTEARVVLKKRGVAFPYLFKTDLIKLMFALQKVNTSAILTHTASFLEIKSDGSMVKIMASPLEMEELDQLKAFIDRKEAEEFSDSKSIDLPLKDIGDFFKTVTPQIRLDPTTDQVFVTPEGLVYYSNTAKVTRFTDIDMDVPTLRISRDTFNMLGVFSMDDLPLKYNPNTKRGFYRWDEDYLLFSNTLNSRQIPDNTVLQKHLPTPDLYTRVYIYADELLRATSFFDGFTTENPLKPVVLSIENGVVSLSFNHLLASGSTECSASIESTEGDVSVCLSLVSLKAMCVGVGDAVVMLEINGLEPSASTPNSVLIRANIIEGDVVKTTWVIYKLVVNK